MADSINTTSPELFQHWQKSKASHKYFAEDDWMMSANRSRCSSVCHLKQQQQQQSVSGRCDIWSNPTFYLCPFNSFSNCYPVLSSHHQRLTSNNFSSLSNGPSDLMTNCLRITDFKAHVITETDNYCQPLPAHLSIPTRESCLYSTFLYNSNQLSSSDSPASCCSSRSTQCGPCQLAESLPKSNHRVCRSVRQLKYPITEMSQSSFHLLASSSTSKLVKNESSLCWNSLKSLYLFMVTLLLCSQFVICFPSSQASSLHQRYQRSIDDSPTQNSKLNRTLKLADLKQPNQLIDHFRFCGEPPLVPNAQSNLQRNQKHFVFPLGQMASYMCDQGYKAIGGISETRCTIVDPDNSPSTSGSSSHVIFPDKFSNPNERTDVVPLGSGRSKNSKRLISDLDEEPDINANGHRSVVFPTIQDKRKMSRKSDDDLMGTIYDSSSGTLHLDGRTSNLDIDSADYLDKRNQNLDKNSKTLPSYYDVNRARWWPPVTLNCQLVSCSVPGQVEHASRIDPPNGIFSFNSNVHYKCDDGYDTIGFPMLTCRANGTWNRLPPKCVKTAKCPSLPALNDGQILYSSTERLVDSRAEFHCNSGFRLNAPSNIRHCRNDYQWSELEPLNVTATDKNFLDPYRCIPAECPAPVRPHAGLRILKLKSKYLPGDFIIYSCVANRNKASAKCRPDGEWSRGAPHCPDVPIRCRALSSLAHGNMTLNDEQNKAFFTCSDGYHLEGATVISCLPTGVWSSVTPRCVVNISYIPEQQINSSGQVDPNLSEQNEQLLEQTTSKTLTFLLTTIAVVSGLVMAAGVTLFCRWRQQKINYKRWQRYFGHYHHRQSKTNIVLPNNFCGDNHMNGNGETALALTTNSFVPNAASKRLLQGKPTNSKSGKSMPSNFLQSSFSSADENGEVKSLNTGTISSEHARTVSTYADDTCPEDDYEDDDEDDYDLYSTTSILQKSHTTPASIPAAHHPTAASRRQHNSLPPPETTPMMIMSPASDHLNAKRTLSTGTEQHIYSNLPQNSHSNIASLVAPAGAISPAAYPPPLRINANGNNHSDKRMSTIVPVTDL